MSGIVGPKVVLTRILASIARGLSERLTIGMAQVPINQNTCPLQTDGKGWVSRENTGKLSSKDGIDCSPLNHSL